MYACVAREGVVPGWPKAPAMRTTNHEPTALGNALAAFRKGVGLTGEDLALQANLSASQVSNLETQPWGLQKRDFHRRQRQEHLLRVLRVLRSRRLKHLVYDSVGRSQSEHRLRIVAELLSAWESDPYWHAISEAAALIPSLAPTLGREITILLGSPDQATLFNAHDVDLKLLWSNYFGLRPLLLEGRSMDLVQQSVDMLLAVQLSDEVDAPEWLELQAWLQLELALAFHEALRVSGYRAIFDAVKEARLLAEELDARHSLVETAMHIKARGEWFLGMAERKISEELALARKLRHVAEAEKLDHLRRDCLAASMKRGRVHPLVLALETPEPEDRLWVYTELIKLYARSDWAAVLRYAKEAQALIDANPSLTSQNWRHMLSVFREALARAHVQHGHTQEADDLITEAERRAVTNLNIFEARVMWAIILWASGKRDQGREALSALMREAISLFQEAKIRRLAVEYGIALIP